MAHLDAHLSGDFSLFGITEPFEKLGRIVLMREHPDFVGDSEDKGDRPVFEATDRGEPMRVPGQGTVRVEVREHRAADYRVTVWVDERLSFQTIPCGNLRVACYLANLLTLSFRLQQPSPRSR